MDREETIKKLQELQFWNQYGADYDKIADWVEADRKRVVEPLVRCKEGCGKEGYTGWTDLQKLEYRRIAIDQTLANAGLS